MGQERLKLASHLTAKIYKEPGILLTCHTGQEARIENQMARCPKLINRLQKKEHFFSWFDFLIADCNLGIFLPDLSFINFIRRLYNKYFPWA